MQNLYKTTVVQGDFTFKFYFFWFSSSSLFFFSSHLCILFLGSIFLLIIMSSAPWKDKQSLKVSIGNSFITKVIWLPKALTRCSHIICKGEMSNTVLRFCSQFMTWNFHLPCDNFNSLILLKFYWLRRMWTMAWNGKFILE